MKKIIAATLALLLAASASAGNNVMGAGFQFSSRKMCGIKKVVLNVSSFSLDVFKPPK